MFVICSYIGETSLDLIFCLEIGIFPYVLAHFFFLNLEFL